MKRENFWVFEKLEDETIYIRSPYEKQYRSYPLALIWGLERLCIHPQFQITEQDKKVIPDQWSGSPALKATKAADLSEWWSTWSDPEIARLVAASQAANTDVRSAQENLRYAQAR